jgi:hypothetical protein
MRRSSALISWLAALCIAGCTHAEDPSLNSTSSVTAAPDGETIVVIEAIQPLMNAQPLPPGGSPEDAQKLEQWLIDYLKGEYQVTSKRLFEIDGQRLHWMSIQTSVANDLVQPFGACSEDQPWHSPGYDLIAVWRLPKHPYKRVAVATLWTEDRASDRVVGYFELDRVEGSRNAETLQEENMPCPSFK